MPGRQSRGSLRCRAPRAHTARPPRRSSRCTTRAERRREDRSREPRIGIDAGLAQPVRAADRAGPARASSPTSRAMLVSCIATPRSQARASGIGRARPSAAPSSRRPCRRPAPHRRTAPAASRSGVPRRPTRSPRAAPPAARAGCRSVATTSAKRAIGRDRQRPARIDAIEPLAQPRDRAGAPAVEIDRIVGEPAERIERRARARAPGAAAGSDAAMKRARPAAQQRAAGGEVGGVAVTRSGERGCIGHQLHREPAPTRARRAGPRRDACRRRRDRGAPPPRSGCAAGTRRSASAPARARTPRRGTTSSRSWKSCGVSRREVTIVPLEVGQHGRAQVRARSRAGTARPLAPVGAAAEVRHRRQHVERIAAGRRERRDRSPSAGADRG